MVSVCGGNCLFGDGVKIAMKISVVFFVLNMSVANKFLTVSHSLE